MLKLGRLHRVHRGLHHRITRLVAPDAWLAPCPSVYRMAWSFLSATALSSAPPLDCLAASASRARRVRSEFSAAASSDGFSRSASPSRLVLMASTPEWTIFPSRWPTVASTSWRTLPLASVVSASVCAAFFPLRPMSSGYCATWISGKAPPPPKSACDRGTQPLRWPCGGGRLGPAAAAAGRDGGGPIDDEIRPRPRPRGPTGGLSRKRQSYGHRSRKRKGDAWRRKKVFQKKRRSCGQVCVLKVLRQRGQLF